MPKIQGLPGTQKALWEAEETMSEPKVRNLCAFCEHSVMSIQIMVHDRITTIFCSMTGQSVRFVVMEQCSHFKEIRVRGKP